MKVFIFTPELSLPNISFQVAMQQDTGVVFLSDVLSIPLAGLKSLTDFQTAIRNATTTWATSKGKTLVSTDIIFT